MPRDSRREPPETLEALFAEAEYPFRLEETPFAGKQHGGPRSKLRCPACDGGKQREHNFFVLIDRDMMGATWHCFRANSCGWSGGGRLKDAPDPDAWRKPPGNVLGRAA